MLNSPTAHVPPVELTVSVRILRSLFAMTERKGVSQAALLAATRIDAATLAADDGRITQSQMDAAVECAIALSGDSALGLHWAEHGMNGLAFAPVSPLMAHAPTFGDALAMLRHYGRLLSDHIGFVLVEGNDHVSIRRNRPHSSSQCAHRFAAEAMLLGFFRVTRMVGPELPPALACFDYPAPPYRAEYARAFDGNERFDAPHTELVFTRAMLDARSPHQDDDMQEALRRVADRRIVQLGTRAPYALRVRELLLKQGPHRADMKDVARSLGLSVRSLRRRLADEGRSYNEVSLEALALTAKRHLRDEQLSIQETAYEMGFSDTSTFHRAFKRWTGMTPSAFRDGDAPAAR
ncbi:MAG: AraC family transcriptional regulator [Polyangiales bacterium]